MLFAINCAESPRFGVICCMHYCWVLIAGAAAAVVAIAATTSVTGTQILFLFCVSSSIENVNKQINTQPSTITMEKNGE